MSDSPPGEAQEVVSAVSSSSAVSVPRRWVKLVRRLLDLKPGRYTIVLSVYSDVCDWSIQDSGRIER